MLTSIAKIGSAILTNKWVLGLLLSVMGLGAAYLKGRQHGKESMEAYLVARERERQQEINQSQREVFKEDAKRHEKLSKIWRSTSSDELLCLWSEDGWGPKDHSDRKKTCAGRGD